MYSWGTIMSQISLKNSFGKVCVFFFFLIFCQDQNDVKRKSVIWHRHFETFFFLFIIIIIIIIIFLLV